MPQFQIRKLSLTFITYFQCQVTSCRFRNSVMLYRAYTWENDNCISMQTNKKKTVKSTIRASQHMSIFVPCHMRKWLTLKTLI